MDKRIKTYVLNWPEHGQHVPTKFVMLSDHEEWEADMQARLAACEAELVKWQRIRTPTHGPCCTCQKCGQDYDECRCGLDEVADELEQTKARVQTLEARLEIDHHYDQDGQRVDVPPDQRDKEIDGIECRDETIRLLEGCIHKLEQEQARLRSENEALRKYTPWAL